VTQPQPLGRQAQKTQQTQENILSAVVSLICEGGYAAATSSQIAERAGVSWGAVQHQFGSKERLLLQVIQRSFDTLNASLAAPSLREGGLDKRIGSFVDTLWQHHSKDIGWASLEILLALRREPRTQQQAKLASLGISESCTTSMREIFADCTLADDQVLDALIFVHSALQGLSIQDVFDVEPDYLARHIRRLKQVLYAMLSGY
tara:strand:+ start:27760 stop:28371 length:612 start_codon:yes stop_codon:yes gene_type:complete